MDSSQNMTLESPQKVSKHPCVTCQRRKVKCDRRDPCTRCLKSGQECTQPEAHRAPRKSRRTDDANVLDRVRQLEHSLEQMRTLVASGKRSQDKKVKGVDGIHNSPDETGTLEDSVGRLIIDDEKTRYISGSSWANLADQVGDLRTLLEDDECPVEDELSTHRSFTHYLSNGMFSSHGMPWEASYSQTGLDFLWQAYKRNIDPVMKVVHVPSTQLVIEDVISGSTQISKGLQCLLAAIKFAAVTSISDEACWTSLNAPRKNMLDLFRSEVQATLDAANFLATHSLITLQAYVIYQFCNRRHEHPRAMWVASGIAIRLAQSIGLHRDGALMKLPVLMTEIRRRLFWEMRMIDLGCAEDCGFLPTHIYGADTRLPLNINDADINSETSIAPPEREGFTDMTYAMIRYEMCNLHRVYSHEGRSSMGILQGDRQRIPEQTNVIADCKSLLESKYLRYCAPSIPFQRTTLGVGQIIMAKQSLMAQYPLFHSSSRSTPISKDLRDELFETSCKILELTDELINDPETSPWTWMLQTYVHWHPVTFLLNELCAAPQHPQSARAWSAIEKALSNPRGLTPEANQALWRPLRGLLDKARLMTGHGSSETFYSPISSPSNMEHNCSSSTSNREPDYSSISTPLNEVTMAQLPGKSFTAPSTAAFNFPAQQPTNVSMFMLNESLGPPDDILMTGDLHTPFATITDFMTDGPNVQFDFTDSWWINNDLTMQTEQALENRRPG